MTYNFLSKISYLDVFLTHVQGIKVTYFQDASHCYKKHMSHDKMDFQIRQDLNFHLVSKKKPDGLNNYYTSASNLKAWRG